MGGHGGRWGIFTEDVSSFVHQHLPVALEQGKPLAKTELQVLGEDGQSRVTASLFALSYPDAPGITLRTVALAVQTDPSQGFEMWSAFPCCMRGDPCSLEVASVREDCRGTEGIITASHAGGASVIFFDPLYATSVADYRPGSRICVALSALTYMVEKAENQVIEITNPEQIRAMRAVDGLKPEQVTDLSPIPIRTAGMSAYFPATWDDREGDDFEFQSRIHSLHLTEYLGERVYVLGITLCKPDDQAITCQLHVPERSIRGGYEPQVGDDIRGSGWLQGRLLESPMPPLSIVGAP